MQGYLSVYSKSSSFTNQFLLRLWTFVVNDDSRFGFKKNEIQGRFVKWKYLLNMHYRRQKLHLEYICSNYSNSMLMYTLCISIVSPIPPFRNPLYHPFLGVNLHSITVYCKHLDVFGCVSISLLLWKVTSTRCKSANVRDSDAK